MQRFGGENGGSKGDNSEELLKNIQEMLINRGFSGLFTYSHFNSNEKFEDIVLNVRKAMTVFRYAIFEGHPDFSLELMTYFLVQPHKFADKITEMKYSLEGIQDGNQPVHFFAPGFREVTRRASYPEILALVSAHYLIQKFNDNALDDKYILAIERFNRIFKENHDPIEDIQNLITAFEHLFKPKKVDKAYLFAKHIIDAFRLNGTSSSGTVKTWSEEFYKVRGEILHGNAFMKYTPTKGFDYWEQCFKWKHPSGKMRYKHHALIASKIFQLLVNRHIGNRKILKVEQLEQMLTESEIEPLVTPNEVYYRRLKELADLDKPFDHTYFDIIFKIKRCDGTEEKSVLFELMPFFLNAIIKNSPELKKQCEEIIALTQRNDTHSMSLKLLELSKKIGNKVAEPLVINDETFIPLCLSGLFEKVFYQLTNVALREMSTS